MANDCGLLDWPDPPPERESREERERREEEMLDAYDDCGKDAMTKHQQETLIDLERSIASLAELEAESLAEGDKSLAEVWRGSQAREAQIGKEDNMIEITRTERGWTGHLMSCFLRNTLLSSGDIRIVILTTRNGNQYETRAFHANKNDIMYFNPDKEREIKIKNKHTIDYFDFCTDLYANFMHENIIDEIRSRMENGEFLESQDQDTKETK